MTPQDVRRALLAADELAVVDVRSEAGVQARFLAAELTRRGVTGVRVLAGGTAAWVEAVHELEPGPTPLSSAAVDVYRRPYEGVEVAPEAMQAYLDCEYGLVAQLEQDGTHRFRVLQSAAVTPPPSTPGRPGPDARSAHRRG